MGCQRRTRRASQAGYEHIPALAAPSRSKVDLTGIWKWNGGEGSALGSECKGVDTRAMPDASDARVRQLLGGAGKLDWGGCTGCLTLAPDGSLRTPWGEGRWGVASTPHFPDVAFAYFFEVVHMLRLEQVGEW